jgi:hypothetical protein
MTALIFSIAVILIFLSVLITEPSPSSPATPPRPLGLLRWLSTGNWPAKLGAALLVLGCGALLRYALIHIELPPQAKLAGGFILAAALAFAAFLTGRDGRRRSIALALGGTAFGVAYLTAYSAYALFGYVTDLPALVLLAAVSIAAAVFAVSRNAISVAILAMLGAFLAPAFALRDPGASTVLGYYFVASLVVLAMILARGWRPLIHLSFLFTLASTVFFGWTTQYYQPAQFAAVYPWLLALVAVHLTMPIAEQRGTAQRWLRRADGVYTVALPFAAVTTAVLITPTRASLAWLLGAFSVLWLLVAIVRRHLSRDGAITHAVIAACFLIGALATAFEKLPWELVGLAMAVAGLLAARNSQDLSRFRSAFAGAALLFAALHIVASIFAAGTAGQAFWNTLFAERLAAVTLLTIAAQSCRPHDRTFTSLLTTSAALWACAALGFELARFDWIEWPLMLHFLAVAAAVCAGVITRRIPIQDHTLLAIAIAVPVTASLVNPPPPLLVSWLALGLAPIGALFLLLRPETDEAAVPSRLAALIAAPIAAALWSSQIAATMDGDKTRLAALALVDTGLLALICARRFGSSARAAADMAAPALASVLAVTLAISTVFDIARTTWAVLLEFTCLAGLVYLIPPRGSMKSRLEFTLPASIVGGALVLQATLLRVLGPPGHLDISALFEMAMPAVVSLLWAALGAAFAIWGGRVRSRTAWIGGAILMVAAAVKVVLVDFGSLGQLSNILAIIAAGLVFMLVGWLAPMPPAAPDAPAAAAAVPPMTAAAELPATNGDAPTIQAAPRDSGNARAWIITLGILALAAMLPGLFDSLFKGLIEFLRQ